MTDRTNHSAKKLILMRHAKSDWSGSLSDCDRPLNERGKRDAPQMAKWLDEVDAVPDRILCSSAARTRETLALLSEHWEQPPQASFSDSLYLSPPETIVQAIRSDGCDAAALMIIAHNPGISQLASILSDRDIAMPTAAIAVFDCYLTEWTELRLSSPLSLAHFMKPKAL